MKTMKPLCLAFAFACALGAGQASAQTVAPPQVPVSKRIVLLVDEYKAIRNFPVLVAERLGYLRDNGMDVTIMNTRDDLFHTKMLADGRIDAVMAYYHHTIVAQAQGNYLQSIVTLGVTPGAKVLVANRAKDKFKTLADLKGSRFIAGGAGSSKTTVANYLVLAGGNKLGDYTRLGTDGKEKNALALSNGAADFVVAPTPDGTYYEEKQVATVFADLTTPEGTKKHFGTLFPSSTVFMSSERVRQHPEIAQHLATAFVRALKYINTHSAEQIADLIPVEATGKDRAAYLKILKEEMPMFATDGSMPDDAAAKEFEVLATFNPKLAAVKLEQTYSNAFVKQALKQLP